MEPESKIFWVVKGYVNRQEAFSHRIDQKSFQRPFREKGFPISEDGSSNHATPWLKKSTHPEISKAGHH